MVDLILRGGRLALWSEAVTADVAVKDGLIIGIGTPDAMPSSRRVIDVTGADVLPGALDVHVHFAAHATQGETFEKATRSAAHGYLTTIIPFLLLPREIPTGEAIDHTMAEAQRSAPIDFSFHLVLLPRQEVVDDVDAALGRGITSFKLFTTYRNRGLMADDGLLLHIMQYIGANDGIALLHAENNAIIERLEQLSRAEGRVAPQDYPATRPGIAESEAIQRAILLAATAACRLYIVHVSTATGLREILRAKAEGLLVYGETCPQYLLLTASMMSTMGPLAKIAPPLRTPEDQNALWDALRDGQLDVVASDHSPLTRAAKSPGLRDIFDSPVGAPGTETLLPLLYSEGVQRRGLPLSWLARVVSENPARIFGLFPRKGRIAPGADADFVVLDPHQTEAVQAARLHTTSDFSLFEGLKLQGGPVLSIVRGQEVVDHSSLHAQSGYGQFLPRGQRANGSRRALAQR